MYRSIRCVRTGRPPLAFRCVIACVYPLGRPLEHQGRKTWIPVIRTFIAASAERYRMNVLRKSYTLSAVSTRMRLGHNLDARSTEVIKSDISNVFMDVSTAINRGVSLEHTPMTVSGGIDLCWKTRSADLRRRKCSTGTIQVMS